MDGEQQTPAMRRREIGSRLAEIRARIEELGNEPQAGVTTAALRLAAAERGAQASLAAAEQAFAASVRAFQRAAEAHDHLVSVYERAAASGTGSGDNKRLAAFHRAAAAADRQRADEAQQRIDANKRCGRASGGPAAHPA